jgi:hypothetical protein
MCTLRKSTARCTSPKIVSRKRSQEGLSQKVSVSCSFQHTFVWIDSTGHEIDFVETARELAGVLRNVIFVDQPGYPIASKEAILKLLEEHITENMVKVRLFG